MVIIVIFPTETKGGVLHYVCCLASARYDLFKFSVLKLFSDSMGFAILLGWKRYSFSCYILKASGIVIEQRTMADIFG